MTKKTLGLKIFVFTIFLVSKVIYHSNHLRHLLMVPFTHRGLGLSRHSALNNVLNFIMMNMSSLYDGEY